MSKKVRMPSIAFIVARSYPQHVIGCENELPWKLKTDLKFFREITEHHAVIMGRKTFDSIGHPLPNRMNIVVSRAEGNNSTNLMWVKDRESALFFGDFFSILKERTQLMVIGGAEIYSFFGGLVNKVFLTEVFGTFDKGDAFFPLQFDRRKWKPLEEKEYPASELDQYPFRISVLERRLKHVRQRDLSDFFVPDADISKWVQNNSFPKKLENFQHLPEEQYQLPMVAV